MTKYEIKIKNSLNLPCHTNTLYEIESDEDLLEVATSRRSSSDSISYSVFV